MLLGSIFSFIGGSSFPFCALVMAQMMDVLAKVDVYSKDKFRDESNKWCLWFLIISSVTFVAMTIQFTCWSKVAEGLTMRLRQSGFRKILRMPAYWFDEPDHNPGTLAARLGSDTHLVNGLTSTIVNI